MTQSIGQKLMKLREDKGWSLREAERQSKLIDPEGEGISKSRIADIEVDKANPSVDKLELLARSYGVNLEFLFKED